MVRLTQIEQLARDGELKKLKYLIGSNYSQLELDTAVTIAIAFSRLDVAEYLLDLGAKMENLSYEGVYYAVHNNEFDGLKFAIDQGVDVNIFKGSLINTSIETAINTGDCKILKWLLANGANPKYISRNSKRSAMRHGTLEIRKIINDATKSKNLNIVGTYALGIICIAVFILMKKSTKLNEFLDKAEHTRADWKFGTFAITGLIQYGLLTFGISIITVLTILLIREKHSIKSR